MPIPQINNKKHPKQFWRTGQKKYFVSRKKPETARRNDWLKKNDGLGGGRKKIGGSWRKKIILSLFTVFLLFLLSGLITIAWLSRELPDPNHLIEREMAQSTKIYDRTGATVLYEIHGNEKRTLVSLQEIPDYVKQATVAIEDKDYYQHGGISLWGIFRGVVVRILSGKSPQGGSTLTQQFVKNAILTPERSIIRKFKEWILAYRLEKTFSKEEILQMYFNEIPYGSTAYGVEAASQRYFAKSVKDINLAEAAILAALPQAPSKYSPYGPNIELLVGRQHYILDKMLEQGYITEPKAEAAKQYKLIFAKPTANIIAPHFVMYVKEKLAEKYGEKAVEQGGLKIYTTLDLYKQKIAEDVIAERTPQNEEKYHASNTALISLDPKTGQILAMVGSRDYFNEEIDGQVNITTSPRQPGSSLKPLVYAAAFLKGYTPNTILYDVVTNFSNDPNKPYEPHNYNNKEHGPVTIRQALAGSLNIPAVKAIYLAGINNVLDLASNLGYTTLNDRDRFGLSLVLGGGEVKLLEHANAYSAFAREGFINPVTGILKVEDKDGKVLEEFASAEKRGLDPKIARLVNDILSDNNARSFIFGANNWLTLANRPVAAKTGTTNDYRDAWTIGYTPSLVAGVWVGNNDNSEMKRGADGGVVAAPIWHDYMERVLGDTPVEVFKKPEITVTGKAVLDGLTGEPQVIKIDRASGLLATEYTPETFIEEKAYYEAHCILYYLDREDPLGAAPKDPGQDPQFRLWEDRVLAWAEKQRNSTSTPVLSQEAPPTEYDNLHKQENQPTVDLVTPGDKDIVNSPLLIAGLIAEAPRGINRAEYYINDNLLAVNYSYPFGLEKNIDFLNNGFHNLKVRVCDDIDNCTIKEVEFNLNLRETTPINEKITVAWSGIKNGLAVSNIDFPLLLGLTVSDIRPVARADFYYSAEDGSGLQLINTIQPITSLSVNIAWEKIPPSGTYRLYGEVTTWDKRTIKSPEIKVIINNVSQNNESNR
ncbi:MAG: PBP1A family penicillin-binding protein [Planctomycetes bacterium]|jgi:1A family penicillin-binding protein|nr:PBP1A family penicillin-binding protein [Planctomycetota bacterium]